VHKTLFSAHKIAGLAGLMLAGTLVAHAQGAPVSMEGKTAGQFYKNVQVIKDIPAEDLNQAMHLIKGATGLDCETCHDEKDRSSDSKELKVTARKMMRMVMDINKNSFDGEQTVTCYTCHRGSPIPVGVPIMPVSEPVEESKPNLPPVDQILARYVDALGGQQAIKKITSRVITGTQYLPTGPGGTVPTPATIEQDFKAPNLILDIYHTAAYTISDGFDGTTLWSQDARGRVTNALKLDQARARRGSDFYAPLNLKQQYAKMEVEGIERVNGRDAYVVVGTPQNDVPERLYFDTQTGLLLRKQTALPTAVGLSPFQVNYDDYRDTGSGVKVPYLIIMYPAAARTELAPTATIRVTKVVDNAPLDDAKFVKPEAKAAAAQ